MVVVTAQNSSSNPGRTCLWVALLMATLLPAAVSAEDDLSWECLVEPMVIANVGSPVQGIIEKLNVDRSEFVHRGQAIAELQSYVERAAVAQAEARAAMQSEMKARSADLDLARHTAKRMKDLHAQNMVPTQQRDEAQAELHVAGAALKQAQENYMLLQHELTQAKELLRQRTIRSPVDGVVVEHNAFPGEFVYENPIMTIAQLDPLRVEVVLPGRMFGSFRTGDVAKVYPEIGTSEPLLAEVQVVDRLLDTRSGTFGLRLTLPNPDFNIPGGQKCRLEFQPREDVAKR